MLYFQESVRMVVAVSIHFSTSGLSACSMRMRYSSGLIGEGIYGSRHIIAPQEIALHGLRHTALDVIVVCGINLVATTKYRCHTCSQGTFSIARSIIREIAVIETCLRTESVTVIEVLHKYIRSRSGHFVGTSPLFRQAVQSIILVIHPVARAEGTLVAVLRENQAVGIVIHHFHISCTGKFLPDTAVTSVVFVLEGILVEIGRALIHGLQHKAEVAFVVIHIVGVVRFAAFHLTRQYNMSHLIGKGVAHVQVFIGGFNNRKLTGKIAYRKQKADDSRSQTEKQIPCLYSKDISRESFSLLNQRFGDLGTMGEEHTLKQNILSYQETSKYKIPFFRKCIIRFLPTSFSG